MHFEFRTLLVSLFLSFIYLLLLFFVSFPFWFIFYIISLLFEFALFSVSLLFVRLWRARCIRSYYIPPSNDRNIDDGGPSALVCPLLSLKVDLLFVRCLLCLCVVPNLLYVCEYIKFYEGPTTNPQAQRQIDLSVEAGRARDPAVSIDITAPFWELGLRELLLLLLRRKPAEKKKKAPRALAQFSLRRAPHARSNSP